MGKKTNPSLAVAAVQDIDTLQSALWRTMNAVFVRMGSGFRAQVIPVSSGHKEQKSRVICSRAHQCVQIGALELLGGDCACAGVWRVLQRNTVGPTRHALRTKSLE